VSANSSIEWTEKTWNPVRGCSIVSPGCVNCYAMKQAHRFSAAGKPYHGLTKQTKAGPQWTGVVRTVDDALLEPLSWRKPARVFVNSMSDLFHEDVPDAFIDKVFAVMALAKQHTFQILTKRADRLRAYLGDAVRRQGVWSGALHQLLIGPSGTHYEVEGWCKANGVSRAERERRLGIVNDGGGWYFFSRNWPLPNIWLGVSVENQKYADERIPVLLQTPAAVRFISAEPLLGPVDLSRIRTEEESLDVLNGLGSHHSWRSSVAIVGLDWVIVGGESGPGARPFDLAWARSIVQQGQAAGVACFVKQLGRFPMQDGLAPDGCSIPAAGGSAFGLRDRKGGDPDEWPPDLRVRQFPEVRA
jgi:protein gp37